MTHVTTGRDSFPPWRLGTTAGSVAAIGSAVFPRSFVKSDHGRFEVGRATSFARARPLCRGLHLPRLTHEASLIEPSSHFRGDPHCTAEAAGARSGHSEFACPSGCIGGAATATLRMNAGASATIFESQVFDSEVFDAGLALIRPCDDQTL